MGGRALWRLGQTLLLVAAIAVALAGLTAMPSAPTALAGVAYGDNDNDGDTNEDDEDRFLRGQVIAINEGLNPPELTVANVDGDVRVILYKTDEIARNGVQVGDYVRLDGAKESTLLFFATNIDVTEKFGESDNDND